MPQNDLVMNAELNQKLTGNCNCNTNGGNTSGGNNGGTNTNCYCPPPPPYPPQGNWCPPPPPPYPYPPTGCDCDCGVSVGSLEAQISKLSKKSATIRKMIDNLINRNKGIVISIGCSSYNFGTYTDKEGNETDYGKAVLEMLQTELEAIKAKIVELTGELEVEDATGTGVVETTVTL